MVDLSGIISVPMSGSVVKFGPNHPIYISTSSLWSKLDVSHGVLMSGVMSLLGLETRQTLMTHS
jgi:hypothetical protein